MNQPDLIKNKVKQELITEDNAGRRIDNYLLRYFNGLPKSRIYQMLRKGEGFASGFRLLKY